MTWRTRITLFFAGLLAVAVAHQSLGSSSATVPTRWRSAPVIHVFTRHHRPALGEAGGEVPGGTTVFDEDVPAVAKLDPSLLRAVRQAAVVAGGDGVDFTVNGGWRSAAYEDRLRRQAVAKYGSEEEAARWVATGETSAHVEGKAVDIGPAGATAWLSVDGASFGLCQIYVNEPWHYELRPEAVEHGCPAMYADPTQDPRMQK